MNPVAGARRGGAVPLRRALTLAAVTICATGAFASVSHAADVNVIGSAKNVVEPGTAPVNSLPATATDDSSQGTPYTAPTSTSTSPAAGGDDNYSESFRFDYGNGTDSPNSSDGNPDQTVQTLNLNLPPGLLASLAAAKDFCTPEELGTNPTQGTNGNNGDPATGWLSGDPGENGCPADSQIGEVTGHVNALSGNLPDTPISGNLYLEKASSSSDVAEVAVEVEADVSLLGGWYRAQVASGPIRFVTDRNGQPALQVSLTLPGTATLATSDGALGLIVDYVLQDLTQTINGLTAGGAAFSRMPTSDAQAAATTTVSVQNNSQNNTTAGDTVPGVSGSGSASITPTGAASLPYAPQLSAAVARDSADYNVALNTTISQASDEAASRGIVLHLPASLQPNLTTALTALCTTPNATASNCQPIGTVTADTPLLPAPLTGTVYLTGSSAGPALTLAFPPPVGFALSGAVDLRNRTVTFPNVPDLPLTKLSVNITGGAGGIFETTCTSTSSSDSVSGSFTGQNGATGSSTGAYAVSNCPSSASASPPAPAPSAHLAGPPTVKTNVRHLTATGGRVTVQVRRTGDSPAFTAVTLSAPSGVRYVKSAAKYAVAAIGAKVKSASVDHGKLRIVFAAPTRSLYLTLHRSAFTVTSGLARRIESHKTKTLPFGVSFTTASLQTLTVTASATL